MPARAKPRSRGIQSSVSLEDVDPRVSRDPRPDRREIGLRNHERPWFWSLQRTLGRRRRMNDVAVREENPVSYQAVWNDRALGRCAFALHGIAPVGNGPCVALFFAG